MAIITISPTGTNDGTLLNAALAGASLNDTVFMTDGGYDINTTVLGTVDGVNLKGESEEGVNLIASAGFGASRIVLFSGVDNCEVTEFTVDGNSEDNTQGLEIRNTNDTVMQAITSKNTGGHQLMCYGNKGLIASNLTTDAVFGLTGTSHGFDFDGHSYALGAGDLTRSGTTATAAVGAGHKILAGDPFHVLGADQSEYNGVFTADSVTATEVLYTVSGAPISPATGTISVNRDSLDCTVDDSTLFNSWGSAGQRQCNKVENSSGVIFTNVNLNSMVIVGDPVAGNVGVTYKSSFFDRHVQINERDANTGPDFDACTFSDFGGVILVRSNTGKNIPVKDCTFLGRNRIVGYDGTNFIAVTSVTETGSKHSNIIPTGGINMFASYNDPGSDEYKGDVIYAAPHVTPAMAHNNIETLVENTNLDADSNCFSLLSAYGDHLITSAHNGINPAAANSNCLIEGYPNRAVIDMTSADTDYLKPATPTYTWYMDNIQFKNFVVAGQGVAFMTSSILEMTRMLFSDQTANVNLLDVRDGASLTLINPEFRDLVSTLTSGIGVIVGGTAATLKVEGLKAHDITCNNSFIRVKNVAGAGGHDVKIKGGELYNIVMTQAAGASILIEETDTAPEIDNMTFHNNSGATNSDIVTSVAMNVRNSIFDDNNTTSGAITFSNCVSLGTIHAGNDNFVVAIPFTDIANNDYSLVDGTSCIGGGAKLNGTDPNYIGANGEPFPDWGYDVTNNVVGDIDIGANQSLFGPFHTDNL